MQQMSKADIFRTKNTGSMGESSKFLKSWTLEIQILKLAVHQQNIRISNLDKLKMIKEAIIICVIQDFEADFLWKVSLKILNSGKILKMFTHVAE